MIDSAVKSSVFQPVNDGLIQEGTCAAYGLTNSNHKNDPISSQQYSGEYT